MRVIILAKAPVSGQVKTRLMPIYSAREAMGLHQKMIVSTLTKVLGHFNDVWLAVDDPKHVFFIQLRQRFDFTLCEQGSGNLGQRLQYLMDESFIQDACPIMFLGTDSPHVAAQRYLAASEALSTHTVAIGPVEDGGYDLLATKQDEPALFEGIDWGTSSVFQETMSNIKALKLRVKVLGLSFDLDRPEDIRRAPPASW